MVATHKAQAFEVSKGTTNSWQGAAWCVGRRHSLKSAASLQGSKVEHCKKEAIQHNKDHTSRQVWVLPHLCVLMPSLKDTKFGCCRSCVTKALVLKDEKKCVCIND